MRTGSTGWNGVTALLFAVALVACAPQEDIDRYGLRMSPEAEARGYLPLVPVSYFDLDDFTPVDGTNLAGRVARLRAKIRALAGPVIPARDRARLEAAIARR